MRLLRALPSAQCLAHSSPFSIIFYPCLADSVEETESLLSKKGNLSSLFFLSMLFRWSNERNAKELREKKISPEKVYKKKIKTSSQAQRVL